MTPNDYIKQKKAIIVADDFAMSQGTDSAIKELLEQGKIHFTSALVTSHRFGQVLLPNGTVGLHLDFTFGKAVSIEGKSLVTDERGYFNKTFAQIMLLCVLRRKEMQRLTLREIEAQIFKLKEKYPNISHIDGHQHIHMNPLIFSAVQTLAVKYGIPRIRFINERIFQLQAFHPSNCVNLVKLCLLRFLGFFCDFQTKTYFVSILNTCKITKEVLEKYQIPKGFADEFSAIEIMLHPSDPSSDAHSNKEKSHLLSKFRTIEKNSLEN